jgi:hypothetical protein
MAKAKTTKYKPNNQDRGGSEHLNDIDFKSIIPKVLSIMKSNNNKFSLAGKVSLIFGPSFDI